MLVLGQAFGAVFVGDKVVEGLLAGGEFRTGPHGAYFLWPADTEFK